MCATTLISPVFLIGNYVSDQQQSMQRYADLLRLELERRGHMVVLLRPSIFFGRLRPGPTGFGKWLGYIDKFILFPFTLRRVTRRHPDGVVHICDHSNAMYSLFVKNMPRVVTCHDLLAIRAALGEIPQSPTGWTGRRLQAWILAGLRSSDRILCVSEETRRQLLALPGFASKPVHLVPNGLNYPYFSLPDVESHNRFLARPSLAPFLFRPYILFIGGTQWYKNREGVLRIFLRYAEANFPGCDLLFAGKPFTDSDHAIITAAREDIRSRIHHVGAPDNEGLHALYCRAECLLFPSFEEGFGWPIIEAMSCGCRVVTSARPPMNEIGGRAAVYVDPSNEAEASAILGALLAEKNPQRVERIETGFRQAALFSTDSMIDAVVCAYQCEAEARAS